MRRSAEPEERNEMKANGKTSAQVRENRLGGGFDEALQHHTAFDLVQTKTFILPSLSPTHC